MNSLWNTLHSQHKRINTHQNSLGLSFHTHLRFGPDSLKISIHRERCVNIPALHAVFAHSSCPSLPCVFVPEVTALMKATANHLFTVSPVFKLFTAVRASSHLVFLLPGTVTVNGQRELLPLVTGDLVVHRASSSFLLIKTFGAQLLWHLDGPLALITLQPGFANKVTLHYTYFTSTLPLYGTVPLFVNKK